MTKKTIDFIIRVEADYDDFGSKQFLKDLTEFADRQMSSTLWKYSCLRNVNYPTEFKEIYCHFCEGTHTHISENGDDFKCLKCEAEKIREIISK